MREGEHGATNDQLKALVKSHADGDNTQFYLIAMQVAARAARAGQLKFAQDLRDIVDELRQREINSHRVSWSPTLPALRDDLAALLTISYPDNRLSDLVYTHDLAERIVEMLFEQRQRDLLAKHGLRTARRLLFTGPPGTGKSSTAKVIAGELGLAMYTIRLETVISKYLEETAAKLRLILDAVAHARGVYLFDEVDALAGERASPNDVGEIRRVLNSFLQFLEDDPSDSIIIAATNHPALLDRAIFRRVDAIIDFGLPDDDAVRKILENRLASFLVGVPDWDPVARAARGLSHADITIAGENAAKRVLLSNRRSMN